jgi:hypothetical protein
MLGDCKSLQMGQQELGAGNILSTLHNVNGHLILNADCGLLILYVN